MRVMRRVGLGLVLFMTAFAGASACQSAANLPKPTVTAKGTAGDEDIPDLTIRQVHDAKDAFSAGSRRYGEE